MNTSWQYPETIHVWHSKRQKGFLETAIDFIYLNNLVKTSKKYLEMISTDVRLSDHRQYGILNPIFKTSSIQESLISKASVFSIQAGFQKCVIEV
jgi:hypothetical protein